MKASNYIKAIIYSLYSRAFYANLFTESKLSPIKYFGEAQRFILETNVLIHSAKYLISAVTPKNLLVGMSLLTALEKPVLTGST